MWRRGARVVADGEVHVERVEKIEVFINGISLPKTTTVATSATRGGGGVQPAPAPAAVGQYGKEAAVRPAPGQHGKEAAVRERDINVLAEEFIRRNRAAFQGGQITGDHGGGQMP